MRKALAAALALIFSASAASAATPADLDRRVAEAQSVVAEIMRSPDQGIPEDLLVKCEAIAIYPAVFKGGFILGARYGRGVVVKRDKKTGKWGPAAFSTIGGGSWGLQAGVQSTDLILVIMNDRGLEGILSNNLTLGADASISAGPLGRSSEIGTDLSLRAGIFSYSRSRGLFGGIALDGAVLTQDNASNSDYYGRPVSSKEILLEGKVSHKPATRALADTLNEHSQRFKKRISR